MIGVVTSFDPKTGTNMDKPTIEQVENDRDDWKAMWLAEVYRGDHGFEETYSVSELDRARQKLAGWSKSTDKTGNITAEFDS